MTVNDTEDMFVHRLERMYYVENRLVEPLDEMADEADNDKLQRGFADRDETREQVERLERAFDALGRSSQKSQSRVHDALREEHDEFTEQTTDDYLQTC